MSEKGQLVIEATARVVEALAWFACAPSPQVTDAAQRRYADQCVNFWLLSMEAAKDGEWL